MYPFVAGVLSSGWPRSTRQPAARISTATSLGRAPVMSITLRPGELAHPGQLAAGVVARAALHRLDVAGQQLLEAQRLAGGGRGAGRVGPAHLLDAHRRRASRPPGHRCAHTAPARSMTRPTSSVGWRHGVRPQLGAPRPGGSSSPASSSSSARTIRWRSPGAISAAAHGARAARMRVQRLRVRAARARPSSARALPRAGGGRRLSSVSAARRYRPVPPTTIGRRPRPAARRSRRGPARRIARR